MCRIQEVIEAQERTITDLLRAVKEQHDQLDNQKTKIKILEEKVKKLQRRQQTFALSIISNGVLSNSVVNITLSQTVC